MSLIDIWPVLGVRVMTPSVELFVPGEDALADLARLAPKDIYDPQNQYLPRTPVAGWTDEESPEVERRFLGYYWSNLADCVGALRGAPPTHSVPNLGTPAPL